MRTSLLLLVFALAAATASMQHHELDEFLGLYRSENLGQSAAHPSPFSSLVQAASSNVEDLEEEGDNEVASSEVDGGGEDEQQEDEAEEDGPVVETDLTEDDLDLDLDDLKDGWPAVTALLDDARKCSERGGNHARCHSLRRLRHKCRPCHNLSRCTCRALHVIGKLLQLRGKWKVQQLNKAIQRLGEQYQEMQDKIARVSARDMEPRRLMESFGRFSYRPKAVPVVFSRKDLAKVLPPRRQYGWQKRWVKWGWLSPKHPHVDPEEEKRRAEQAKNGIDLTPRIVRHSCPGGELVRRDNLQKQQVVVFKERALGGNFFNDVNWSICFRASVDCSGGNTGGDSRWQVVFGGQCGQPIIGYVGGHWVFGRQCGGAPSIAFSPARCGKPQDVSVIKKGQRLCFVVDGLQTQCHPIDSKFKPFESHVEYAVGAGFHDGREIFRGQIHWLRVGSALIKEGEIEEPADKKSSSCPDSKEAIRLEKKDFIADPILQFESVAGYNCTTRTRRCRAGVAVANHYAYAGAQFSHGTVNIVTEWASSPSFAATNSKRVGTFGNKPIEISFAHNVNRVGFVLLGRGKEAMIQTFDSNHCKTTETKVQIEAGRHPSANFVGLAGAGNITKVVVIGESIAVDDVQFGNDDLTHSKPVRALDLETFNGDTRATFESVAGASCRTRTATCPEGLAVEKTYQNLGLIFGEGVRTLATPWATSFGFAAANGPVGAYSNRPLIVYFTKPVERVGFSVLGVGGNVKVQLYDKENALLGASTVEYVKGRGQFSGFGGVGAISRLVLVGRGFAIDDLTFSSSPATPIADADVINDIGEVRAWYRSDKGITVAENGNISSWQDQSSNRFDLSQEEAAMQPQLVEKALNGHPVVSFDGVDDLLSNHTFKSCTHKLTIFAVFKLETFGAHLGYPWALGNHKPGFITQETEGTRTIFDVAFGHENDRRFEIPESDRFRLMTYAGSSKSDIRVWAEGKAARMEELSCCHGPTEFANPAMPCFERVMMGGLDLAISHPVQNTRVQWAEFIVFEKELTRLQREQVEEYLMKKYKLLPPTGVTTCASIQKSNSNATSDFYDLHMSSGLAIRAFCDMTTDGGGWTRIQVINKVLSREGTLGSAAHLQDVIEASGKEFRFTDDPNGAGEHNLYIKDEAPTMGMHAPVAHTWTSAASRIGCRLQTGVDWKWTSEKQVSCDKTVVGHHTCGSKNGWILWHSGNTYNIDGKHPCAQEEGQATPFLRYLWVR